MGNLCFGSNNTNKSKNVEKEENEKLTDELEDSPLSTVLLWEQEQNERNSVLFSAMKEEFFYRPDTFIVNMLVLSTQFFKNFDEEKKEVTESITKREKYFSKELSSSNRSVIFIGGHEEIASSHILYKDINSSMLELPTRLQLFIVQENCSIFAEDQIEELLAHSCKTNDEVEYTFTAEAAKRHPGYIRLRSADTIQGLSRSNTYDDIYSILPKPDESMPDPVMDLRPIRTSSIVSQNIKDLQDMYEVAPGLPLMDDEEAGPSTSAEPFPKKSILTRRPSGVLPSNFQWKQNNAGRKLGFDLNLEDDRRPSGIFPKMSPAMEKSKTSIKKAKEPNKDKFDNLKAALSTIGESSEEEENSESSEESEESSSKSEESYSSNEEQQSHKEEHGADRTLMRRESLKLDFEIQKECFLNKKIKFRAVNDAYNVATTSEQRTYLSSNRYLDVFEENLRTLLQIVHKDHLYETCKMQTPAIHLTDIMDRETGPIFNTEYIPSFVVKGWPRSAFEWTLRERKHKLDPVTKFMYRWPLNRTIQEAIQMGYNLVPIGYYNPKNPTKTMEIEWQIQFVDAEKVLLRTLRHPQIRLLLLTEYLMRDHLGLDTQLRTQHLRYILFYMCEANFRDWDEERLGVKLKHFLKTLYKCLSAEKFPHYFVDQCNMMDSFPMKDVRSVQATVKKMTDNLPLYLMQTLIRTRIADGFYPKIDIKKLYKIITPKEYHGNFATGLIDVTKEFREDNDSMDYSQSESEDEEDKELKKKLKAEYERRKEKAARRPSTEESMPKKKGLDLSSRVQSLSGNRSEEVLKLFADQFISMAKCSIEFNAFEQAYMYILLVENLCSLLEECNASTEALAYKESTEELRQMTRQGINNIVRVTPKHSDKSPKTKNSNRISNGMGPSKTTEPNKGLNSEPKNALKIPESILKKTRIAPTTETEEPEFSLLELTEKTEPNWKLQPVNNRFPIPVKTISKNESNLIESLSSLGTLKIAINQMEEENAERKNSFDNLPINGHAFDGSSNSSKDLTSSFGSRKSKDSTENTDSNKTWERDNDDWEYRNSFSKSRFNVPKPDYDEDEPSDVPSSSQSDHSDETSSLISSLSKLSNASLNGDSISKISDTKSDSPAPSDYENLSKDRSKNAYNRYRSIKTYKLDKNESLFRTHL